MKFTSKATVDGVDVVCAAAASYLRVASDKGPKLVGRSFNLKSAYRQLPVSDASLRWARLAVYCPVSALPTIQSDFWCTGRRHWIRSMCKNDSVAGKQVGFDRDVLLR